MVRELRYLEQDRSFKFHPLFSSCGGLCIFLQVSIMRFKPFPDINLVRIINRGTEMGVQTFRYRIYLFQERTLTIPRMEQLEARL